MHAGGPTLALVLLNMWPPKTPSVLRPQFIICEVRAVNEMTSETFLCANIS